MRISRKYTAGPRSELRHEPLQGGQVYGRIFGHCSTMGSSGPVLCENHFLISVCYAWYYTLLISSKSVVHCMRACYSRRGPVDSGCATLLLLLLRKRVECDFLPHLQRRLPGCGVHLKLHLVGLIACPQAEIAGKVAAEELLFLDCGQERLVDRLLVSCAGGGRLLFLLGLLVFSSTLQRGDMCVPQAFLLA
jgi:hypothetical protein